MPILPYCGAPPIPGTLGHRWNSDPVLILSLLAIAVCHLRKTPAPYRVPVFAGWLIAALAFLSPLCALSVSLFSARVGQHMILVLFAAPLIATGLGRGPLRSSLWWSAGAFAAALWAWHMPLPYDATFRSDAVYWSMHVTLFGTAIWLWRDLLNHARDESFSAIAAGTAASMAMALLGAVVTLASHPMYDWHLFTTEAWGLSPLADQQLGGVLMWVPGCILFIAAALRSTSSLWRRLEAGEG